MKTRTHTKKKLKLLEKWTTPKTAEGRRVKANIIATKRKLGLY